MATVRYTTTSNIPLTVTWRCSRCGCQNTRKKDLIEYSNSYKFEPKFSKRNLPEDQSYSLNPLLIPGLQPICGIFGHDDLFPDIGLNFRCKACGNKEPWCFADFKGLDQALGHGFFGSLAWIAAIFFLLIGVIGLFKLDLKMIAFLGIVAIMVAVVLAQIYIGRRIIKEKVSQIDSLPGNFYPVIVVNDRPLFSPEELAELKEEYKAKNHPQENPAISTSVAKNESEPEKTSSSADQTGPPLFCKKCGKRIPSNSLFCQFCGDPVDTSIAGSTERRDTATTNTAHEAVSPSARKADGNGQMEKELAEYNNLLKTHQISKSEYDILVRITTDKYTNMQH